MLHATVSRTIKPGANTGREDVASGLEETRGFPITFSRGRRRSPEDNTRRHRKADFFFLFEPATLDPQQKKQERATNPNSAKLTLYASWFEEGRRPPAEG